MENQANNENNNFQKYLKYSSLVFEMGIIIGAGAYFGSWLDKKFNLEKPVLTAVLAVIGVLCSMFLLIKRLKNDEK